MHLILYTRSRNRFGRSVTGNTTGHDIGMNQTSDAYYVLSFPTCYAITGMPVSTPARSRPPGHGEDATVAVGPVEYLVIAFPGSGFPGTIAPALAGAVASGAVRPADLAFVRRTAGGAPAQVPLRDLDAGGVVPTDPDGGEAVALTPRDLDRIDGSVPPGDTAAIVVREDLWTTEAARAVREAGGSFVAHERLGSGDGAEETAGDDIIDRLERLADLWKREILSDEEFVEQKTRLLSD